MIPSPDSVFEGVVSVVSRSWSASSASCLLLLCWGHWQTYTIIKPAIQCRSLLATCRRLEDRPQLCASARL